MRKAVLSMVLLVLIGAPAALAQGGSSTVAKNAMTVQDQREMGVQRAPARTHAGFTSLCSNTSRQYLRPAAK